MPSLAPWESLRVTAGPPAEPRRDANDEAAPWEAGLDVFQNYLLAIAGEELSPALRARLGPSDVVQETYLLAQRARVDFRGTNPAQLRAWLREILLRRCQDLHDAHLGTAKRNLRREVRLGSSNSFENSLVALGEPETPSRVFSQNEENQQLLDAIEVLPEEMRLVVRFRHWEGLAFDEIGLRLGRTGEAARKLFSRAVDRLGKMLESPNATPLRPR